MTYRGAGLFNTDDTICAIASAAGQAQRGIVRISGPEAIVCLESMLNEPVDLQELQQPTVLKPHSPIRCLVAFAQLSVLPHRSTVLE